jgi:hypothetical protein
VSCKSLSICFILLGEWQVVLHIVGGPDVGYLVDLTVTVDIMSWSACCIVVGDI